MSVVSYGCETWSLTLREGEQDVSVQDLGAEDDFGQEGGGT